MEQPGDYSFNRCKLCGEISAVPLYRLQRGTVYGCRHCDFHALDYLDTIQEPSEEEATDGIGIKEWDYIEERLGEADPWLAVRLELVRRYCRLPQAAVLDVGAGVGQFLTRIAGDGAIAHGIEPSRVRRQFARRRFGLELSGQMIEHPWWQEQHAGRFDLITFWDVLEHVNFPQATLTAACRLLKPGGLLFIDTPSRDAASYRLSERIYRLVGIPLYLEHFYSPTPFGHKQIFRPGQLVHLAQQTGFQLLGLHRRYPSTRLFPFLAPSNRILLVGRNAAAAGADCVDKESFSRRNLPGT